MAAQDPWKSPLEASPRVSLGSPYFSGKKMSTGVFRLGAGAVSTPWQKSLPQTLAPQKDFMENRQVWSQGSSALSSKSPKLDKLA